MFRPLLAIVSLLVAASPAAAQLEFKVQRYKVTEGAGPHDVAVSANGVAWYTAQAMGALGRLDPKTGAVRQIKLGERSAPHGVVIGPDAAPWITDSGQNAIIRVDPKTEQVTTFPLPKGTGHANLNTLTFDRNGTVWFTGQAGIFGRADSKTGNVRIWDAPKGRGPYGIATTPAGDVWFSSLAGNYIARVDTATGEPEVVESPTPGAGARRVWSDSQNRLWVSLWGSGEVGMYDPAAKQWKKWKLPGGNARTYSVYVDETDGVWLTDFGPANAVVRFDPKTETFRSFPSDRPNANVRQMLGRPGEAWAPESGLDRLTVIRYEKTR
ncbi:MAG TPA: lyase [Xanthobacteraceae bacterium]